MFSKWRLSPVGAGKSGGTSTCAGSCALGEDEADLAFVLGNNNVEHPLGDACDNLDR